MNPDETIFFHDGHTYDSAGRELADMNTPAGDPGSVPDHYNKGINPFDIIDAFKLDFYGGNALKYLLRYQYKGSALNDIDKAIHYLQELRARVEKAGNA